MTRGQPDLESSMSSSISDLVDRICDEFEAALRRGQEPQIADFLSAHPRLDRLVLFRELVGIEIDYANECGKTVELDRYYPLIPNAKAVINAILTESQLAANEDSIHAAEGVVKEPGQETVEYPLGYGRRIKQFELISILGQGGFGVVWRARDNRLQRNVALKLPRLDRVSASDQATFLREARAVAKLRHPNIVPVHEVGEDRSGSFIVSELIEGKSLKEQIKDRKFPARDAAVLVSKLATALQHAHEHGVVHRDIKPANVLLDERGEPHVTDFGLAKRDVGDDSLSIQGKLVGTPAYMAPEQAIGDHKLIDRRTDIYSLGAILYELLTGRTVFRGEITLLLQQIRDSAPEPLRSIRPEIPKDLEAICLKCLQKDREKRYQSAKELADDLHLFLAGETLRGIPAELPDRLQKWFARNRRWVLAIAVIVISASAISTGFVWYFHRPEPPSELREVVFTTIPPGCEITVVAIHPETGEPDPQKIQHAPKDSKAKQVTMNLEPGDYLVVAMLDEFRFHEVYRRVPSKNENDKFREGYTSSTLSPSGAIIMPQIVIPRRDVSVPMAFIEGTDRLTCPRGDKASDSEVWRLPAFCVDREEISIDDLKEWRVPEARVAGAGLGPSALQSYFDCLDQLEQQGKRLPSAAELYYLSTIVCPDATPCIFPDGKNIEGLHSGVWEWTTTQPGGPFSNCNAAEKLFGSKALPRMVGCGNPPFVGSHRSVTLGPFQFEYEMRSATVGARGVRSAKARRTPLDFAAPVAAQSPQRSRGQ